PEFAATYSRNALGTFTPVLRGARWDRRVRDNPLVGYFEQSNRDHLNHTNPGPVAPVTELVMDCRHCTDQPVYTDGASALSSAIYPVLPDSIPAIPGNSSVLVGFIIGRDSLIHEVEIIRSAADTLVNNLAIRTVEDLGLWVPAMNNGEPVNCRMNLRIRFTSATRENVENSDD